MHSSGTSLYKFHPPGIGVSLRVRATTKKDHQGAKYVGGISHNSHPIAIGYILSPAFVRVWKSHYRMAPGCKETKVSPIEAVYSSIMRCSLNCSRLYNFCHTADVFACICSARASPISWDTQTDHSVCWTVVSPTVLLHAQRGWVGGGGRLCLHAYSSNTDVIAGSSSISLGGNPEIIPTPGHNGLLKQNWAE